MGPYQFISRVITLLVRVKKTRLPIPIGSMYGMFTYIWLIFMVNVAKYTSPMDPMGFKMAVYRG